MKVLEQKNDCKLFYKIIYEYLCFFWNQHKRKIAICGISASHNALEERQERKINRCPFNFWNFIEKQN